MSEETAVAESAPVATEIVKEKKPRKAREVKPKADVPEVSDEDILVVLLERQAAGGNGRQAAPGSIKGLLSLAKNLAKNAPKIISLLSLFGVPIPSAAGELAQVIVEKAEALGLLNTGPAAANAPTAVTPG